MANLSISLANLLKNMNSNYTAVSKNGLAAASSSQKSSEATEASKSSAKKTTTAKTSATSASLSNLTKLLSAATKKTSVLNNTSVITNDMETEFFKSYKNTTMTGIYNKLQNGSQMSQTDLTNFNNQVAKLSKDEQNLWKTEISKIQTKIQNQIPTEEANKNTTVNTTSKTKATPVVVAKVNPTNNTNSTNNNSNANNNTSNTSNATNTNTNNSTNTNNNTTGNTTGNSNSTAYAAANSTSTAAASTASSVVTKKTDSNGNILGYDSNNKLVYLEKTVNGKKVVYTDELNYLNSKTLKYLTQIGDSVLTDRMMDDIKIVQNAEKAGLAAGAKGTTAYQNAYNASVKSQMIKTTSNMEGVAGEVVEKNGSLYVNDGNGLVKLNISADTYLNLFPPVDRYDINQNSIGDCYFVSGCLTDMMKNGETYAEVLKMFSEDANGNITVKFAGSLGSYPVTFNNGNLKVLDGKVNGQSVSKKTMASGSKGTQMLEQAFAIATFAKESGKSTSSIDIDETMSSIKGGWQYNVYKDVLGISAKREDVPVSSVESYLNSMASSVNNGEKFLSFASYGEVSAYGLMSSHAYSIESIDTANKVVYIANPWYSGSSIAVPYSVFAKSVNSISNLIYFSVGNIS